MTFLRGQDLEMDLLDLGKKPISEQEPAGRDVRAEPEMEALSAEIEKLSSLTSSSGIDWHKIEDLSKKILAEQSKDLLVACYLCMALLQTKQMKGFAQGIHVLRDLLEHFWETLYPVMKRMRGRRNALEWWLEKTMAALEASQFAPLPQEEINPIREDLNAIDTFVGQNMEEAPSLARLQSAIASLEAPVEKKTEETPQPAVLGEARTGTRPEAAPVKLPAEEPPANLQQDQDAEKALKGAFDRLKEVASFYMGRDLFHPMAYPLTRIAAWTSVQELPPAADSRTRIPAPPQHVRTALHTLYKGGDWEGLLKTAETRIGEFLFWLDLSRLVAESLEHLGREGLRDLISRETALYVDRLKGIEALCFSDGTPFADEETREWLKRISTDVGSGTSASMTPQVGAQREGLRARIAEEYGKAQSLVKEKRLDDAVRLLHQHLREGSSGQERLLWRIALSQLLTGARSERTALPHIQELLSDVEGYRLEQWDPALALEALLASYSGLRSQKGDEFRARAVDVLDRIAALDPAQALQLTGS